VATNSHPTSKIKHSKLLVLTNLLSSSWRYLASNCWVFFAQSLIDRMSCADKHNSSIRSKFLKFEITRARLRRGFCAAAGHSTYAVYVDVFLLDRTSIVQDPDRMSLLPSDPRKKNQRKQKKSNENNLCGLWRDMGDVRRLQG